MLTAALVVAASLVVGQDAESPAYEHLNDLECFIGTWEGQDVIPEADVDSAHLKEWAGKTVQYRVKISWAPGKAAQIIEWVHDIPGVMKITATRIVGWDPAEKKLVSSAFTTQTGIWQATYEMRGIRSSPTTPATTWTARSAPAWPRCELPTRTPSNAESSTKRWRANRSLTPNTH